MDEKEREEKQEKPERATKKVATKKTALKGATKTVRKPRKRAVEEATEVVKTEEIKVVEAAVEKPVAKGDFVLVEMTGRSEETGEVFETTSEDLAKSAGIHSGDKVYGPRLVVVGEGWVLKGLDARLEGLKLGEEAKVEIPPQEAFGERDPNNVRMVPYRLLRSKGINPALGAQLELDGRPAVVRSIGAGRVQLDYNPPLAGRKIIYDVKVTRRYGAPEEKIRALIGRHVVGIEPEKFSVKITKKAARIEVPIDIFFADNLQKAKLAVALDVEKFFPDVDEVEYLEIIKRKT
jgi:FKBP-type peptidyl-prolyl cis-trans isomerase 2